MENLVNAKPLIVPEEEKHQDEMNEFCKMFENAHLSVVGDEEGDQIMEAPDVLQRESSGSEADWNPQPIDNM